MDFRAVSFFSLVAFISLTIRIASPLTPSIGSVEENMHRAPASLVTGADRTDQYVSFLKGKRVAMVVNPTSIIGDKPSVDSLIQLGVQIVKVFGPEHGFRGNASNGTKVDDSVDPKTGIPIISLYGKNRKPSAQQLADVDVVIYDIQDVGARFYTYINTLSHVMEACAENKKQLLILDRPNPNGYCVDGPILEDRLRSGIGMFRIPITHGMTIGEFAQMINGEGWLPNKQKCKLRIVKVAHYTHDTPYILPVAPSPNLNTAQSIVLYPSVCLFEGTIISQGRGTYFPFTVLGAPALKGNYEFSFTPISIKGMKEAPLHQDTECYGLDLRKYDTDQLRKSEKLNLNWLMELYKAYPDKARFFDASQSKEINDFNKLAGNSLLKQQIIDGVSEAEIRKSWEPGLSNYKKMRKKYLLYP
ncbi:DUF1343 domain-containing protein [Spirosoma daeguense]